MQLPPIIADNARKQHFAAGAYLFRQGDTDPHVYWLAAGYLKATYIDADGRESVKSLLAPGAFIGSLAALEEGGTTTFGLRAQTDCEVRSVPYARLRQLAAKDHATALTLIDFLLAFARRKERREFELLCLDASARYGAALEALRDFEDVFTQADIAAYIGITPQALSRIKRRRTEGRRTA